MKHKKIIIVLMLIITLINTIGQSVNAVTNEIIDLNKKASLIIKRYEYINNSAEKTAFKGVGISIYGVSSDSNTVAEAEHYISENNIEPETKTTDSNGTVKFENLELGRYLVVETTTPKNALTKMESFLIDLPRSNDDGKWNYDVTVYPKTSTIYGKVVLTHNTNEGLPLKDATWKLQKQDKDGKWKEYEEVGVLTTNNDGQISIENLEKGNYRLVQNSIEEQYILDQSNTVNFTIDENNINKDLTATSEKLEIRHFVKLSDGNYGTQVGAFTTDTVSWKTVADVASIISKMDKYCITENIQEGLQYDESSIEVYGDNDKLTLNSDYKVKVDGQKMKVDFVKGKLNGYKSVTIKYDTKFDYDNVKNGKYLSSANLEYTNNIDINENSNGTFKTSDEKATVYTGSVLIYKTDVEGNPLAGAKFKIATSKENAENGVFVKNNNNEDVEVISNSNGYVIFNGLKLGEYNQNYEQALTSYWIVETEAPTYVEDGETKYYNLLSKSVEVKVSSTSGIYSKESTTQIINKKGLKLPLTGGVLNIIPIVAGLGIVFIAIVLKKKDKKNEKKIQEK